MIAELVNVKCKERKSAGIIDTEDKNGQISAMDHNYFKDYQKDKHCFSLEKQS